MKNSRKTAARRGVISGAEVEDMFRSVIKRGGNIPVRDDCDAIAATLSIWNGPEPTPEQLQSEAKRLAEIKANYNAIKQLRKSIADIEGYVDSKGVMALRDLRAALETGEGYLAPRIPKWQRRIPPGFVGPLAQIQAALRCAGSRGKAVGRNSHAAIFAEAALRRVGYDNVGREDVANFWAFFDSSDRDPKIGDLVETEVARIITTRMT